MSIDLHAPSPAGAAPLLLQGHTDANGEHRITVDSHSGSINSPHVLHLEAEVQDLNAQSWTSRRRVLIHPAQHYAAFKSLRHFYRVGDPLEVDLVVTDVHGEVIPAQDLEVRLLRSEFPHSYGAASPPPTSAQACQLQSSLGLVRCRFRLDHDGAYQLMATTTDPDGKRSLSAASFWVFGHRGRTPSDDDDPEAEPTLSLDKDLYHPGEVARLRVTAPWKGAELLLSQQRLGVVSTTRHSLTDGAVIIDIPITDAHVPGLDLALHFLIPPTSGQQSPPAPPRIEALTLPVSAEGRRLQVSIHSEEALLPPGAQGTLEVTVRDAAGHALPDVETLIMAVDEAALAVARYHLRDPIRAFYQWNFDQVLNSESRRLIEAISDDALLQQLEDSWGREGGVVMGSGGFGLRGRGGKGSSASASDDKLDWRRDFEPLVVFVPEAVTDANGRVSVPFVAPDNLTRYRLIAVAASTRHFGTGEGSLTVRRELALRPSPPRFVHLGDRFSIPVLVQNLTDEPQDVHVAARIANGDDANDMAFTLQVPANDRRELLLPAQSHNLDGVSVHLIAQAQAHQDAVHVTFPVLSPASPRVVATYGTLDHGAVQQNLAPPAAADPTIGGLSLSIASTALANLTDALRFLYEYPFHCTEQIAARLLGVLTLRPLLSQHGGTDLPTPDDIAILVRHDLERILSRESPKGGLALWSDDTHPFVTLFGTLAVHRAAAAGHPVPPEFLLRLQTTLADFPTHLRDFEATRGPLDLTTQLALRAFACFVRREIGADATPEALALLAEHPLDHFSTETLGWILAVIGDAPQHAAVRDRLLRRIVNDLNDPAAPVPGYGFNQHLIFGSRVRTLSVVLMGLLAADPQNPAIASLVATLLAQRPEGHWRNTQENAWAILALERTYAMAESEEPNFTAHLWLADAHLDSQSFHGRSFAVNHHTVPMATLQQYTDPVPLILHKEGPGRLTYRMALTYASKPETTLPVDRGFSVSRTYTTLDAQPLPQGDQGDYQITRASLIQVTLTLTTHAHRYHVALTDPLPAGFEIVNARLGGTSVLPPNQPEHCPPWHEHLNLRDHQAEAFAFTVKPGTYCTTYLVRATTPGTFVAPPATAVEMYSPEVSGHSSSDTVAVSP